MDLSQAETLLIQNVRRMDPWQAAILMELAKELANVERQLKLNGLVKLERKP